MLSKGDKLQNHGIRQTYFSASKPLTNKVSSDTWILLPSASACQCGSKNSPPSVS